MNDIRIHYLCTECGSSDVFVDASATFTLLEYDDLTRERVEERLVYVDYLYPYAGVERLFGAAQALGARRRA